MEIGFAPEMAEVYVTYAWYNQKGNCLRDPMRSACFGSPNLNKVYICDKTSDNYFILEVKKSQMPYSEEFVKWWIDFMTDCGFPCSLTIQERKFIIRADAKDYGKHKIYMFAGLTAIRYISYAYARYFIDIPKLCYEIKNFFPEKDSLQCLFLAHYAAANGYYDEGHGLVLQQTFQLLTKEEFMKRTEKNFETVNELCTKPIACAKDPMGIHSLLEDGKKESYQKVFDLLTK